MRSHDGAQAPPTKGRRDADPETDPQTADLSVEHLTVRYGPLVALDDLTLSLARGRVTVVLGPNGAGKSSLVECLIGYRRPDAGVVSVLGTDPWRAGPALRARVGVVLQDSRTDADLTVAEYLDMVAGYYGSRHVAVDTMLDRVGLQDHRQQRVHKLSGGQRRRVELAVALIGDPEVLFLDEPTSGLDPQARRELWSIIDGLRSDGRTVVLTTHQLDEAEQLADRVVVLARGHVLHDGTVADLRRLAHLPSTVSFHSTRPPDLPGLTVRQAGAGSWQVVTEDPARDVPDVIAGVPDLTDLVVRTPSFEDVYLSLVDVSATPTDPSREAA